jgi:hypothetical protein
MKMILRLIESCVLSVHRLEGGENYNLLVKAFLLDEPNAKQISILLPGYFMLPAFVLA